MNSRSRAFPLVDSLRAIAVLAIIAIHAGIYAGALAPGTLTRPYLYRFEAAAWAFFLISGLVLYRPWVAARLRGDAAPSARAFGWRRVLRIVPAYWLALVLTGLIVRDNNVFTAYGAPHYFLLGQIYSADTASGGVPQAWTLDVEVAFYVFLPVWAWLMRRLPGRTPGERLRGELLALAALAAASVVYKCVVLWSGAAGARTTALDPLLTALPGFLDVFAIGMALAALHAARAGRVEPPRGLRWLDRRPGLAWLGAAFVLWLAAVPLRLSDQPVAGWTHAEFLARHATNTAIGLLCLLPLAFGDQTRGAVRRVLAAPVLLWLGMVSYGVYLYHLLVIGKLGDWRLGSVGVLHPYVRWYVVAVAGAVLFAAASWYGLERPLQRYRGVVGGGRPDPTSREMAVAAHQPAPAGERAVV